ELKICEPSDVAARTCQAGNQPAAYGIGDGCENDRHRAGLLLHDSRGLRTVRQDYIRDQAYQLPCVSPDPALLPSGLARVDPHIATFAPAELREPLRERGDIPLV